MEKAVQESCNLEEFLLGHGPSLQAIHLVIDSSQGQEFLMGSTLDDAPLVQDINAVGVLNGRKAMSDGNGRPPLPHFSQRILNQAFCFRVNIGCRFIQNQDFRLTGDCSSKGKKLALSSRKARTTLGNRSIIAQRKILNKGICIYKGSCVLYLIITDSLLHGDIGLDSPMIEEGILQDQTDVLPQLFLTVVSNIHII